MGRGKQGAKPALSQMLQQSVEAQRKLYEAWLEATSQALKKSLEAVAPAEESSPLPYEIYDLWVNTYAKMFTEAMNTPLFAATVGQYLDSVLELKKGLDHATGKTMKALGLPTRSDLDEIYQRLVSLERKLHELAKQIRELTKKIDQKS